MLLTLIHFLCCFSIAKAQYNVTTKQNDGEKNLVNWDCDRSWPKIELFLPIVLTDPEATSGAHGASNRNDEWRAILFRSLLLFWPFRESNTSIVMLYDEELKQNPVIAEMLKKNVLDVIDSYRKVCLSNINLNF